MVMPSTLESEGPDPLVGSVLGGKYSLERLIGRGGMGHVYLASMVEEGEAREVVVKVIAPTLALQPQAMARFEREAKRLDGLRHSNVVEMYDYGHENGRAYIVMEHVDGELLNDYLSRKANLTLHEFVPIAAQILKGVGHAHSRDLMIRDIKPANVMLCERKGRANFVKIIDFGLAKMLEGDEDITKQHFIGTSGYLSPEQIKGLDIDLRVDVYALGVLFYQMLSGRMPFEAENDTTLLYKHVHEFPTPLSEVLPSDHEVPEELVHLIHDCLEKDPEQRPRDANEIVEKLIDCVPMSMFRLPPAGHDAAPATAGDTGAVSALSTAALAAPSGETATYLRRQALEEETESETSDVHSLQGVIPANEAVAEPEENKSKLGVIVVGLVGVVAIVGVALFALGGKGDDPAGEGDATAEAAGDSVDHEAAVSKAEGLIQDGEFDAARQALDGVRNSIGSADAGVASRFERADAAIEVGQLMATAKKFDDDGKKAAAISAYEDVLKAQPANAEARERLTELRNEGKDTAKISISSEPAGNLEIDGSLAGTTPYDDALPLGKHTVRIEADGYESWEQEIEVKDGENLPIKVGLVKRESEDKEKKKKPATKKGPSKTPAQTAPAEKPPAETQPAKKKPAEEKSNPFLPTKKKKSSGPFLPTEK